MRAQDRESHLVVVKVAIVESYQHSATSGRLIDRAVDKSHCLLERHQRDVALQVGYLIVEPIFGRRENTWVEGIVIAVPDPMVV